MFVKILNEISHAVKLEIEEIYKRSYEYVPFYTSLYYAIKFWCNKLDLDSNITNYILQGYTNHEIEQLMNCVYQEWQPKLRQKLTLFGGGEDYYETSKIHRVVKAIFRQMNLRSGNMEFIVLIAFVVTAVGFLLYKINHEKQQQTFRREEPRQYNPNSPSPTVQAPPIQTITKHFLVLVVSASQADFLESLEAKKLIDLSDGEALYGITKYLWLGSETDFHQKKVNINQYSVSKEQESEYDIYLIYIELNQSDEGFKSHVDQLDRYDAFRNLDNLAVNFSISPRLKMEAYENFDVYSR